MFRFLPAAALACLSTLAAPPVVAQSGDPANPGAAVRPLVHRSTLAGRTAPDTPELADWRTVNERVRAVGGWKAYLKQVQVPDTPTPEASK
jgi:hypothetical protein